MPADLSAKEIGFLRTYGPQSPVMQRALDAAEAHLEEPTRLAAARAEGYREGVEAAKVVAKRWYDSFEESRDRATATLAHVEAARLHTQAVGVSVVLASLNTLTPPPTEPTKSSGVCLECGGTGTDGPDHDCQSCYGAGRYLDPPAEPSAPVAPAVEDIVHRYAQEYEWRADEGDHTPTDDERALLEDFGNGLLSEVEGRDRDRITALEAENAALREVVAAVAKHVEGMDLGGSEHDHVCYRVDLRTDLLRRARALLQGQGGGDA